MNRFMVPILMNYKDEQIHYYGLNTYQLDQYLHNAQISPDLFLEGKDMIIKEKGVLKINDVRYLQYMTNQINCPTAPSVYFDGENNMKPYTCSFTMSESNPLSTEDFHHYVW